MRARWVELLVCCGLSITTSAVVVAWTVSRALASVEARLDSQAVDVQALKSKSDQAFSERSAQSAQIAVQQSQWSEVLRRLDSIDRQLERR